MSAYLHDVCSADDNNCSDDNDHNNYSDAKISSYSYYNANYNNW